MKYLFTNTKEVIMKTKIMVGMLICFSLAAFTFANTGKAEVISFTGKAEYQSSLGWVSLKVGDLLDSGTVISTGFKSSAVLKIGDSRFTVAPLSRITISKLLETDSGTETEMNLSAGKLKIDVKASPGKTAAFTVKSPVATASIRGTSGDFYYNGILIADTGVWMYESESGKLYPVTAGQEIKINKEDKTITPHQVFEEKTNPRSDSTDTLSSREAVLPPNTPAVTERPMEKNNEPQVGSLEISLTIPE